MLTKARDLRTGLSVWQQTRAPALAHGPLETDIETDVLVVGCGISGAMTAEMLAATGRSVVIVDRRGPVRGSTPASTALLQYEIDTPLTKLAGMIGQTEAIRAWRRSFLALKGLAARIRDRELGNAVTRDSLYLAGDVLDADAIAEEGEARKAAGLETRHLDATQLVERFGIARDAALLSYGNLALDPRALTASLLRCAIRDGARIYAPVEIDDIDPRKPGVSARTTEGHTVRAGTVVFATGYEVLFGIPAGNHKVISTWAIATKPQTRRLWPERCFIWEASEPYLYMRTTDDGRVICGGEDEDFADEEKRDALLPAKSRAISRKLGELFPELDPEPEFAWTGSFGTSTTGLPTIGPVPGMPNCWAVMGFGGNGITYSRVGAEIVRAGITGRDDPDADLFAFR